MGTWAIAEGGVDDPLKPPPLTLLSLPVSAPVVGVMAVDVAEYHLSGESPRQTCHLTGPSHRAWGGGCQWDTSHGPVLLVRTISELPKITQPWGRQVGASLRSLRLSAPVEGLEGIAREAHVLLLPKVEPVMRNPLPWGHSWSQRRGNPGRSMLDPQDIKLRGRPVQGWQLPPSPHVCPCRH